MSAKAGEIVKIAINTFLTTKISYANTIGQVLALSDLDDEIDSVLEAIGNDSRIGKKYLKFGFGRATQDAGIEIRRGAMTRDQAINLVNLYDGGYPHDQIEIYLDYYEMTREEFDLVIDRWTNKELFKKKDGYWFWNHRKNNW